MAYYFTKYIHLSDFLVGFCLFVFWVFVVVVVYFAVLKQKRGGRGKKNKKKIPLESILLTLAPAKESRARGLLSCSELNKEGN